MSLKENADALVESLRQRNFPAFVTKSQANRLYLIFVGPYDDPDAAAGVKDQLKKQGIDAIPTEWKRSAQSSIRPSNHIFRQ